MYPFFSSIYSAILLTQAHGKLASYYTSINPRNQLATGYTLSQTCQNENNLIQSLLYEQNSFCDVEIHETVSNTTRIKEKVEDPWNSGPYCLLHPISFAEYCIYTILQSNMTLFAATTTLTYLVPSSKVVAAHSSAFHQHTSSVEKLKGVIASRVFAEGELIQVSTPVLIVDEDILEVFDEAENLPEELKTLTAGVREHLGDMSLEYIKMRSLRVEMKLEGSLWYRVLLPEGAVCFQISHVLMKYY